MFDEVPTDLVVLTWGVLVSCIVAAGILTGEWKQLLMSLPNVSWRDWTFSGRVALPHRWRTQRRLVRDEGQDRNGQ